MSKFANPFYFLPCPFCGGDPIENELADGWILECRSCGASPKLFRRKASTSKKQALQDWNTRLIDGRRMTLRTTESDDE